MKIYFKPTANENCYHIAENVLTLESPERQAVSESILLELNNGILYRLQKNSNAIRITMRLQRNAVKYGYKRDLYFVCSNTKTGDSIDFTNLCDYHCAYCYVQSPHVKEKVEKHYWRVDADYLTVEKENLFIDYLTERKKIAPHYFLRFFSLADCKTENAGLLKKLLEVCKRCNVKTVVVTKNHEIIPFIIDVSNTVLYSIDNGSFNSPSSIEKYIDLKENYTTLKAFCMVTDIRDIKMFYHDIPNKYHSSLQFVSYHGKLLNGRKLLKPQLVNMLTGKACCLKGLCVNCALQCQINA